MAYSYKRQKSASIVARIWVDQGSESYNKYFTDFLKMNNIEMYSTFNEGKSVLAESLLKR